MKPEARSRIYQTMVSTTPSYQSGSLHDDDARFHFYDTRHEIRAIRRRKRPPKTLCFDTELAEEINRRCEVIDDDSYVVHPFDGHGSNYKVPSTLTTDHGLSGCELWQNSFL